jgi:putative ATP-dependent endonuclease of OLD family
MRISRLKIENFRSIRNLDIDLGDTTVLIGQNNAGKTAILDAVRIVLTRRWGQRGTGFTENDIYRPDEHGDPRTLPLCQRSCRLNRIGTFRGAGRRKWLDTDRGIKIG